MKEIINYYYNINVEEISANADEYILKSGYLLYLFKPIKIAERELLDIYYLTQEYRFKTHQIVKNINNEYISLINEKKYLLLQLVDVQKKVFNNFETINYTSIDIDEKINVIENKMDYIKLQLKEFYTDKSYINRIADYYIGLAENSIYLYNKYKNNKDAVKTFQHRRIKYPNYGIKYYDPTNIVVDFRTRDLAEYYKSKHWDSSEKISIEEVLYELEKNRYNITEVNLFFSRLMYTTEFFDIFEKNIQLKEKYEYNHDFFDKSKEYLIFLKMLNEKLAQRYNLKLIEWIKKEPD